MVKGRRVKAVVRSACTNDKDCYSVKRKHVAMVQSKKLGSNQRNDHCITDYFPIERFQLNQADCVSCTYKSKIPATLIYEDVDIKPKFEELETTKQDNFLPSDDMQKFEQIFSSPIPHRIQLHPQLSECKDVNELKKPLIAPDLKNNINKKIKTQIGKKDAVKTASDHKLTEYFPVRRSVRKTKRTVLEEKRRNLEQLLRDGVEEGLEVHNFEGKGRGVVALRAFNRGDFVVEYSGELLDVIEAKHREEMYAQDANTGCYMYYFKYQNQQYCVDATAETGRLGRLVNHSRNGNLITRTVVVDGFPHLVLIAKDHIKSGEEICYDYGDRSKESLKNHPWLAF